MIKKTKTALGLVAALGAAVLTSAPVSADQISDLNARIAKLESAEAVRSTAADNGNMVFFRFGGAYNTRARTDATTPNGAAAGKNGWNVGAGFDFSLNDDLFGFHDGTEVLAEIMFDYKDFGQTSIGALGLGPVTVSQLTVTASPKIKFLKGEKFRPWIIPMGFGMNVISPTSNGVTYLKPSMHFGLGADYNVWKSVYVGGDLRYNLGIAGATNSEIDLDGLTYGVYLGLGF